MNQYIKYWCNGKRGLQKQECGMIFQQYATSFLNLALTTRLFVSEAVCNDKQVKKEGDLESLW